jgi:hypothetical protein
MGARVKGLAFRKTAEAIAAFVKQHGSAAPRRAVLCTYDLDPVCFEAVVLPELARRRRWFRTLVLGDGGALQKEGVLGQRGAASSYELAPARLKGSGVFHPKLIVLQAGAHMLVGVGSGNLTAGGLGGNLELMLFATNEGADGAALAGSAIQFLRDLRVSRRVILPQSARRFIERFCLTAGVVERGPVLHNLNEPLLDQLAAGRPGRVARLAVVSPWHSASASTDGVEPVVLASLGRALGARPIVFTQGQDGKGPPLGKATEVRILRSGVRDGDEDLESDSEPPNDDRPRRPARLHAKAYLAVGETNATLWFGSANCTTPALRQAAGKGNVELLVSVALDRQALARFDADLDTMFEPATGHLPPGPTPRIPTPRGIVLAGYVDRWERSTKLTIDLSAPSRARRLRIGTSARRQGTIELTVPRGVMALTVATEVVSRLLRDGEVPPVLWEHVADTAIPFPVSVPCAPATDDAEEALQDALDDLAGRVPVAFRRRKSPESEEDDEDDTEERDRELELLTESEHEGTLDRIAVRVEMLRRRIAGRDSPDADAYYVRLVESLALPVALRRVLSRHLGSRRTAP